MIDALIRLSLRNRAFVIGLALVTLVYSIFVGSRLPVEVLPDLTRPTVTILTEAPGLSPQDVERLVSLPLENAVSGTPGIVRLRTESDLGLSLVFVEFDWGTEIYHARQQVQERLQQATGLLPVGITPQMGPVSSLLGEIMLLGISSEDGQISPLDLRTLTDRVIARRIQAIPGISQVLAMGGGVRQLQILPDPEKMVAYGVALDAVLFAVENAASNVDGGYLEASSRELLIRGVGMTMDAEAFRQTPVSHAEGVPPVLLGDIAEVMWGPAPMRGDAGVNGKQGVILSIQKSPGVDTIALTREVERVVGELGQALPENVSTTVLFRQADFIEAAHVNLIEAIRDGAIMVVIVLLLFLLNFRTTVITLTAIPLSFAVTLIVFDLFDIGINSMTLGGIAVAIGMVVDDAIVDIENVFRRLRENRQREKPLPVTEVVASASIEVRSAILYATLLIALVFLPLFGLGGIEGRLFAPIASATIISMLASFLVAITVIPVLASLILPGMKRMEHTKDGVLVRGLKAIVRRCFVVPALSYPFIVLGLTAIGVGAIFALYPITGKSFLPTFNEGSATVTMVAAPGLSLDYSQQMGRVAEELLLEIPDVLSVGRRTGRAEMDEHVVPVNVNEFDVEFTGDRRPLSEIANDIREALSRIPGVFVDVGQPVSHRIDHMLSGVEAQVAVKVYGPDLDELRRQAVRIEQAMSQTTGLTDIRIERQFNLPQLHVFPDREALATLSLTVGDFNRMWGAGFSGRAVAQVRDTDIPVNVAVRFPDSYRNDLDNLHHFTLVLEDGTSVMLGDVAEVLMVEEPNRVSRENGSRRIIISANSDQTRNLIEAVEELRGTVETLAMPEGYVVSFEGQYASQKEASRTIAWLSVLTLVAMSFLLYGHFRSIMLVGLTLLNIPLACAGAIFFTWWLIGEMSLATLIGMIALAGIASRNTILMLSHYLHLIHEEGEGFTTAMVIRGTLERLVPVSMTAITAGIALLPLALVPDMPGREILHPVAVAIIGGLITSTLLDLIVTPTVFYHFGRKAAHQSKPAPVE